MVHTYKRGRKRGLRMVSATGLREEQAQANEVITGTPILVPLTTSLYVPGKLADTSKVLVDVGTGFYVEKSVPDAKSFYDEKTKDIGKNLKDLEGILQGKSNNLRMVEEGMSVLRDSLRGWVVAIRLLLR